jgi:hypothetical protein
VSNIFMKTAGAAIVALNRGYDFRRQYPVCAYASHQWVPFTKLFYTYNTISDTVCILNLNAGTLLRGKSAKRKRLAKCLRGTAVGWARVMNLTTLTPPERKADVR